MMKNKLEKLKNLILNYSYQKKEVRLASGRVSSFYFDGKQTSLHPEGAALIGELFYKKIREKFPHVQAIGGPTLGADPIVTAVSIYSYQQSNPFPAFIVRKEPKGHGTMSWIEGARHLKPGMRVVLVEDVITTGVSLIRAVQRVREVGLVVIGAVVLVDREEGGLKNIQEAGLELESLFKKSDLVD